MSANSPRIDRLEKNYLINGGMDFWQRGGASGSVSISTTPTYQGADRFLVSYTGTVTGTPNVSRSSALSVGGLPNNRTPYAHRFVAQRNASPLTLRMEQRIEGVESQELIDVGMASLSLWVLSPVAGAQVRLTINAPTVLDNYTVVSQIFQQTSPIVLTASTWTKITFPAITIPGSAVNGLAVVVESLVPTGTDGSALNHLVTQVMLNAGAVASDFVRAGASIGHELDLCQRYFEKSYDPDTAPGTSGALGTVVAVVVNASGNVVSSFGFQTTKRATPSLVPWHPSATNNNVDNENTQRGAGIYSSSTKDGSFQMTSSGSRGQFVIFHWTAETEL